MTDDMKIRTLQYAIVDILDYLSGMVDIKDTNDGPAPNIEMNLTSHLEEILSKTGYVDPDS